MDYIHLDFDEIKAETDKALLVVIDDEEYWIPLSQIADSDDYSKGDCGGTISVSEWWAKKEGLE